MTKEKEDYLFSTYPNLFPGGREVSNQVSLMCYGFPGDGWFDIIKDLCQKISDTKIGITVVQVKEKFGTLRFYVDIAEGTSKEDVDKIYDMISEAEGKTEITCEECGQPGKLRSGGWIRTHCDSCEDKYQKRKEFQRL